MGWREEIDAEIEKTIKEKGLKPGRCVLERINNALKNKKLDEYEKIIENKKVDLPKVKL
jgi:hypothetical protein